MNKRIFLYLRGTPGSGKITIARILERRLGWKLFWFHDLKNSVYDIVKEHRIPRLMDDITQPIVTHLLLNLHNVIYVRPSPDEETIRKIQRTVCAHPSYSFLVIRLEASYDSLLARVTARRDPYRITAREDLDAYLTERVMAHIPEEHIVSTDELAPDEAADRIIEIIRRSAGFGSAGENGV